MTTEKTIREHTNERGDESGGKGREKGEEGGRNDAGNRGKRGNTVESRAVRVSSLRKRSQPAVTGMECLVSSSSLRAAAWISMVSWVMVDAWLILIIWVSIWILATGSGSSVSSFTLFLNSSISPSIPIM
jgi:hypothetical protein